MTVVYNIVVAAHLLGMAVLVGGYAATLRAPQITELIVWGARAQLITGIILVGIGEASLDKDYNNTKIAVKFVISFVIVALAEVGRAREKRGDGIVNLVHAVGILAIVNVLVAAIWK
ncbi:hypothetical protein [Aldersonia kunmingensis]|uniref:hypothetical protein n=1 Tax=Aldersonia kunmingensis TaxID=408066 RepID=UPI00082F1D75|nr:hypothetical protein [Aldersonia kunmingensis]